MATYRIGSLYEHHVPKGLVLYMCIVTIGLYIHVHSTISKNNYILPHMCKVFKKVPMHSHHLSIDSGETCNKAFLFVVLLICSSLFMPPALPHSVMWHLYHFTVTLVSFCPHNCELTRMCPKVEFRYRFNAHDQSMS